MHQGCWCFEIVFHIGVIFLHLIFWERKTNMIAEIWSFFFVVVLWKKRKSSTKSNISNSISNIFSLKFTWWWRTDVFSPLIFLECYILSDLPGVANIHFLCVACVALVRKLYLRNESDVTPFHSIKMYWI